MAHTRTRTPLYALAALSAAATFGLTAGVASAVTTSGPIPVTGPVAVQVGTPDPTGNPNIVLRPLPTCRTVPSRCVVIPPHCLPAPSQPVLTTVPRYCPPVHHPRGDNPGGDNPGSHNPPLTPSDPPVQQNLPAATPIQPASAEPTFTG